MKKLNKKSRIKIVSLVYIIMAYSIIVISGTYAYKNLTASDSSATGQGGCFQVNYTGQNLTSANVTSTNIYTEGAKATVTLSKHTSCKLYTEANIYLKTNNSTTAPITTVQALKYKVFSGDYQISEGVVTSLNDYILATVPLTDTATTYTIYLWIDNVVSAGYYTDTSYSGYVYANSAQTSTIEGNYLVNFDLNNGSNLNLSKTVTNGQTYGWLPTPSKTGYHFDGWKLSSTSITSSTTVTATSAHTLVAQWSTATYNVRFNANGGNVSPSSKTVTYGSTYGSLPTPTRGESTFLGWHGKNLIDSSKIIAEANTTVNNGVVTQIASDNKTDLQWKLQTWNDSSLVQLVRTTVKNTTGVMSFNFTKTSAFNKIRFGLNGSTRDTTVSYMVDYLHDNVEYTLSFNITNTTQGSISWNNIQLETGAVATAYEPYYITSTTTVSRDEDHILYAIWG